MRSRSGHVEAAHRARRQRQRPAKEGRESKSRVTPRTRSRACPVRRRSPGEAATTAARKRRASAVAYGHRQPRRPPAATRAPTRMQVLAQPSRETCSSPEARTRPPRMDRSGRSCALAMIPKLQALERSPRPRGQRYRNRRDGAACPTRRSVAGFGWQCTSDRTIASTSAPTPSLRALRRPSATPPTRCEPVTRTRTLLGTVGISSASTPAGSV